MSIGRTEEKLRIVVGGYLGLLPAGGVTWDYVQYPLGLSLLGHDVYYIEDTRVWPVYQTNNDGGADCSANVAYLRDLMESFGLQDRWAYRDEVTGQCFGMSEAAVRDVCGSADLFINISCSTYLRDEYLRIPVRVLIDSDPMFTQVQYVTQVAFSPGAPGMRHLVEGHTHHFTFGENVGGSDSLVPLCGVDWKPTRQPVCLSHWPVVPPPDVGAAPFTTVMNWTAGRPLLYDGRSWGQKDIEFQRFSTIPQHVPELRFAVAVGQTGGTGDGFPAGVMEDRGWKVLDPSVHVPDWQSYRSFIQRSAGEFSVAKETYVKAVTGWFSCRSACYLATGRPVVAQETGWSRHVPSGAGLFAFRTLEEAADALRQIAADPARHARAAREVAEEFFDSCRVLRDLLAAL
jgi:hypothetical protein